MINELENIFGERVFTIWDVYQMTNKSENQIRLDIKAGIFKGDKRKGKYYIRESQLEKYLEYLGIKY